ncbi:hypothetical protein C1T17_01140 [Sphingobium sp. SCG-1]|nr:hypothetical protein C1T17_01140 [Sphingobium sp. SCG-1]
MGVQIAARQDDRLQLSGDIETLLDLPARARTEGFSLAISDDSLIRGRDDPASNRSHFTVAVDGAAIIDIARDAQGDRLDIDWRIDWITLACGTDTLCPVDAQSVADDRQMTLDIGVRQAA